MRSSLPTAICVAAGLAACAGAAVAAGGCGGSASAASGSRSSDVTVQEHDFQIAAPHRLSAGRHTFTVINAGSTYHEFIIAPLSGGSLPLRRDGLTVSEEAVEAQEPGHLEPGAAGAARRLTVNLAPGRYVLFCNLEGHYMGGMHSELVVD